MALHDRLKNPTLEPAPTKGHGLVVMVALAVMAAAFASRGTLRAISELMAGHNAAAPSPSMARKGMK